MHHFENIRLGQYALVQTVCEEGHVRAQQFIHIGQAVQRAPKGVPGRFDCIYCHLTPKVLHKVQHVLTQREG